MIFQIRRKGRDGKFHLERVRTEAPSDANWVSGFGSLALFHCEVEFRFSPEDMGLEEAELFIQNVLNQLPPETIDEICKKACEWKNDKMNSDMADYPDGLSEAAGRDILAFMSVGEVELYRNPHDKNDPAFGAILGGGTEWDLDNGMEIVIRGSEVLEVREFFGVWGVWNLKGQ